MEMGQYVNSPVEERSKRKKKKENCLSGGSKIYRLVGVSFGLLCIIQSALNVSFRLQAVGCSNKPDKVSTSNLTMMSAADITTLILERDQLLQEKDQLDQENDQLLQDKSQMLQEKDQLENEKKMLNEKVMEQENQIQELETKLEVEQNTPSCPQGWGSHKTSCYQLSSGTNNWEYAKLDCERKAAHLVIINDQEEERVVRFYGGVIKMWMGMSGQKDRLTNVWTWTMVDGKTFSYANWNDEQPGFWSSWSSSCAYIDEGSSCLKTWFLGNCREQHYWICEKELNAGSI
ncbi:asialoglycoprotein receptor 1-like [Enoplosus armatus]|uniref:asialoglycoprotein receptor 1-like n=1 Tax=Enoplosus armatus TaxID=215367 RepID=UPI0039955EEF